MEREGQAWSRGIVGAEERAIETWGLDRFNELRTRLAEAEQRWGVARDRVELENLSNVLAMVLDGLPLAIERLANASPAYRHELSGTPLGVLADDEQELVRALARTRDGAARARELVRRVIDRFPKATGATHLEAVAAELVRVEREGELRRASGVAGPFTAHEAATLSVACCLEAVPRDAEAFASLRPAWAERLKKARRR